MRCKTKRKLNLWARYKWWRYYRAIRPPKGLQELVWGAEFRRLQKALHEANNKLNNRPINVHQECMYTFREQEGGMNNVNGTLQPNE